MNFKILLFKFAQGFVVVTGLYEGWRWLRRTNNLLAKCICPIHKMYSSEFPNVFILIQKCICLKFQMYLFKLAQGLWLYRFIMKAGAGRRTERLLASKLAACPSALARLYTGHWTTFKTVFTKLFFKTVFTKTFLSSFYNLNISELSASHSLKSLYKCYSTAVGSV